MKQKSPIVLALEKRFHTRETAAAAMGISTKTLDRLRKMGRAPIHKTMMGRVYFSRSAVDDWVKESMRAIADANEIEVEK